MRPRIVVVSAGLSDPSSTRLLADRLATAAERAVHARGAEPEVTHVGLRPLAHPLADHLLTGFSAGELSDAISAVRAADGLIVVTPVFSASYSGLFKTFFDVIEPGALEGKPTLIAATAGTARHSLVLDHALRPLFAYLRTTVLPTGVFAASEDFGSADLDKRIDRAATELAQAVAGAGGGDRRSTSTGSTGSSGSPTLSARRSVDAEFATPTPFEELLRRASDPSA